MTIANRLKKVRLSSKLTTVRLAQLLGIAQSAITKNENGQTEPSAKTLTAFYEICKAAEENFQEIT